MAPVVTFRPPSGAGKPGGSPSSARVEIIFAEIRFCDRLEHACAPFYLHRAHMPRTGLTLLAFSAIARRRGVKVDGYQGPCSTQSRHLVSAMRWGRLPPVARKC